jgi:hypothetical protein
MFVTEKGEWAVIQQGMNSCNRYARRYHWLSSAVKSYDEEPHQGIVGFLQDNVLDLTSKASGGCRDTTVDLANTKPKELERAYKELEGCMDSIKMIQRGQKTLSEFDGVSKEENRCKNVEEVIYRLPRM